MFKRLAITLAVLPSTVGAQTSTTDCQRDYFGNVHCTTNSGPAIQPVQPIDYGALLRSGQQAVPQPQIDWSAVNEAQRQWEQRHAQKKQMQAISAAEAADHAPALPAPDDEKPVLLACTLQQQAGTIALALYERHARVDVSSGGSTHSRAASFTGDSVSWTGPVFRAVVSRLDMSFTGYGVIPAVQGVVLSGTCQVSHRQF